MSVQGSCINGPCGERLGRVALCEPRWNSGRGPSEGWVMGAIEAGYVACRMLAARARFEWWIWRVRSSPEGRDLSRLPRSAARAFYLLQTEFEKIRANCLDVGRSAVWRHLRLECGFHYQITGNKAFWSSKTIAIDVTLFVLLERAVRFAAGRHSRHETPERLREAMQALRHGAKSNDTYETTRYAAVLGDHLYESRLTKEELGAENEAVLASGLARRFVMFHELHHVMSGHSEFVSDQRRLNESEHVRCCQQSACWCSKFSVCAEELVDRMVMGSVVHGALTARDSDPLFQIFEVDILNVLCLSVAAAVWLLAVGVSRQGDEHPSPPYRAIAMCEVITQQLLAFAPTEDEKRRVPSVQQLLSRVDSYLAKLHEADAPLERYAVRTPEEQSALDTHYELLCRVIRPYSHVEAANQRRSRRWRAAKAAAKRQVPDPIDPKWD
jgi:hypothetical protein